MREVARKPHTTTTELVDIHAASIRVVERTVTGAHSKARDLSEARSKMPRYQKAGHESSPSRFYPFFPAFVSPSVIKGEVPNRHTTYDSRSRKAAVLSPFPDTTRRLDRVADESLGCTWGTPPMTIKCKNTESTYASVSRSLLRNDAFGGTIIPDERRPCSGNHRGESRTGTSYRIASLLGWK